LAQEPGVAGRRARAPGAGRVHQGGRPPGRLPRGRHGRRPGSGLTPRPDAPARRPGPTPEPRTERPPDSETRDTETVQDATRPTTTIALVTDSPLGPPGEHGCARLAAALEGHGWTCHRDSALPRAGDAALAFVVATT